MNKSKKFIAVAMLGIMLTGSVVSVSAKTLAESFSGGSDITCTAYDWLKGCQWKKTAWAKTTGYTNNRQQHYVRSYIGSMDNGNLWADSGRKWAYGDVKATCSATQWDYNKNTPVRLLFPKAYAKYGN